jgi:hypothetical protein
MIKIAKTQEELDKCGEFLYTQNAFTLDGTVLFYIEETGKIVCAAGYNKEFGGCIEPLYSTSLLASYQMFYFMQGVIAGQGYKYIRARTTEEKVKNMLIRDGFKHYTQNEYFKEL